MNFGVLNLVKEKGPRHFHLGVSALLAALFCAFLGVPQSSARSIDPTLKHGSIQAAYLRALPPLRIDVAASAKVSLSIKTEFASIKREAISLKAAKTAFARARLRRISRDYARPTSNYRLTAGFGERSRLWGGNIHTGQDFAAPYGTSVRAAEAGTIIFAGWAGGYGRKIEINHGGQVQTWYGHLSSINVKVGQHVKVGQFIGRVGASGNATGAHLHFEVRRYGVPINPVNWLRAVGIWV